MASRHEALLLDEDDPPSVAGSPTVAVRHEAGTLDSRCTGTLIAPRFVLTTTGCWGVSPFGGFGDAGADRATIAVEAADGHIHTRDAIDCFVHPQALLGTTGPTPVLMRCSDIPLYASSNTEADLVLVELGEPIVDTVPRGFGPPHLCREHPDSFVIRSTEGEDVEGRRQAELDGFVHISAGTTFGTRQSLRFPAWADVVERLDGGGTVVEPSREPRAPIVSVVRSSGGPAQDHPLLWRQSLPTDAPEFVLPIDWIWSVLDPSGQCALGASGGCRIDGAGAVLPDRDRDGLADVRDLCPNNAPGDFDGDGVVEAAPVVCGDGVNRNHCDGDNDWVGDECDLAPGVCDHLDTDGDDRPDLVDNCPEDANSLQENCNLDAEAATIDPATGRPYYDPSRGHFGRGDVCDPVPCADARLESRTFVAPGSRQRRAMDQFRIDGLRAVDAPAPDYRAWTGFRFCRCSAGLEDTFETRTACILEQLDGTGGCAISDTLAYDEMDEPPLWRWMVMSYPRAYPGAVPSTTRRVSADSADPRLEVLMAYDAPTGAEDTDALALWNQDRDISRWIAFDGMPLPFGPGYPLLGVTWDHTVGDLTTDPFDSRTRALASHYSSRPALAPVEAPPTAPCFGWVGPFLGDRGLCPECNASFPAPFLGWPGTIGAGGCSVSPGPAPVLRLPYGGLDASILFAADPAILLGGISGRWVEPSEPDPWLPQNGIRYVALSPLGDEVERLLVADQHGRLDFPPKQPPPLTDGFSARAARTATSTDDFVPVLSARRRLLWVIPESGTGDIRVLDLFGPVSGSYPLPPSPTLGRVLAATYSPRDDALYLLDAMGRGGREVVRLVRIEALGPSEAIGPEAEVLASWPRVARHERVAIGTDPSGALWVAGSRERGGAHSVVRLEVVDDGVRLDGFAHGPGVLAVDKLRADRRGVSLVVSDGRGRHHPVGYRTGELRPLGHRDLGRCF